MDEQTSNGEKSLAFLEKSKNIKIIIALFIFTVGFSFLLASKYFQDGEFQVHDSIFDFDSAVIFDSEGIANDADSAN